MELTDNQRDDLTDLSSLTAEISSKISYELNKRLKDIFVEGLKRKGFEFENRVELEDFVKSNCRCEDNKDIKLRTYFVNDTPFFLHYYGVELLPPHSHTEDRAFTLSANYGSFTYL